MVPVGYCFVPGCRVLPAMEMNPVKTGVECSDVSIFKAKASLLEFELNSDVLRMNMLHVCSHPWVYFEEGTRKTSPQLHQMEQRQQTGRRKPPSMLQRK